MKNMILTGFCAALILMLAACTTDHVKAQPIGEPSSAVQTERKSSVSDSDSTAGTRPRSSAKDTDARQTVYTQQTTGGTEGAVITFLADGTFEFRPVFYDGSPFVTGTYETTDSGYTLTVQETTAHNIIVDELGAIGFHFDGDNLIYQGTAIGETSDGAVFAP